MADYVGNSWYKCDLHLHTMCSKCYLEKDNTPEQWVSRALEQGLQVCAVTDHNDYRGISAIQEKAQEKGLVVFPGVEITCDSTKIHILILFNVTDNAEKVRDFLNRCDIDSDMIGNSDGTSLSVFEVCQIAKKRGAMVIAAHIDEFNAISSMNPANLDRLLSSGLLDAVQIVNGPIWEKFDQDKNRKEMVDKLSSHYGKDATPEVIDSWRKCYNRAKEAGLPMLAFSDNPYSPEESKHGLDGIGSVYTWIQMDKDINLESLRQALLTPQSRIRMSIYTPDKPNCEPWLWLQSIEIRKTELNPYQPIHLDFNPQLNCIIGGRGSGKSAIVRVLSGVYRRLENSLLINAAAQENEFYKKKDKDGSGIFRDDSEIEIFFRWYGYSYRLLITDIESSRSQTMKFLWIDPQTREEIPEKMTEDGFRSLFSARVFTQREFAEMACTQGALLQYADNSVQDMFIYKKDRDYAFNHLVTLGLEIRNLQNLLLEQPQIILEKNWITSEYAKKYSDFSEETLARMTSLREQTLQRLHGAEDRLHELQAEQENCMKSYQENLALIRKVRTALLNKTLQNDGNYRMELIPQGSHDSFRQMLRETFHIDMETILEDIRILEDALFSKNDGTKKYRNLLISIRKCEKTQFSDYFCHQVLSLTDYAFERLSLFCPEDELVIFYHPNGVKKFFPITHASAGEKAAAVLAFVLANNNGPVVIDQPEDDLDNYMIYDELIGKLKRAKEQRQLILVTHDANITANADPEMIISMNSHSKFNSVRLAGSIDNPEIQQELCEVLEGSSQAFRQRARKYHIE